MAKQIISKIPKNVQDLTPDEQNPRTITDEKLTQLEKSMRKFGDLSGIVFNVRTGRLIGGHQRTKKIQGSTDVVVTERLKKKTEQGTIAYGHIEYEGEKFAVRLVDWSSTHDAMAAKIAANQHGGRWDLTMLSDHLLELDQFNFDMDFVGFSRAEMENLFAPKSDGTKEVSFTVKEGAKELDPDSFNGTHKCPKCGFEFDGESE